MKPNDKTHFFYKRINEIKMSFSIEKLFNSKFENLNLISVFFDP